MPYRSREPNTMELALVRFSPTYLQSHFVVGPTRSILEVLVRKLPTFERVGKPILEPANLLSGGYVQKTFCKPNAIRDHHAFEFIDLIVTSMPLPRAGKPLYPFNQNAPVPRAIENYDLAGVREPFPEALQIVSAAFVRQRRRDRIYLKASRV